MSEQEELLETNRHAHAHIDALQVSGVSEHLAVVAFTVAAIERAVRAGGKDKTASWLRSLADRVEARQMDVPQS